MFHILIPNIFHLPEKFTYIPGSQARNMKAAISDHHEVKKSFISFSTFNPGKVENSKASMEDSNRINFQPSQKLLVFNRPWKSFHVLEKVTLTQFWKHAHEPIFQRLCALVAKSLPQSRPKLSPCRHQGKLPSSIKVFLQCKDVGSAARWTSQSQEAENEQKDEPVVGKTCDLDTLCSTGWFP